MKYEYTWNHILLLAKICAKIDDEDSLTASWVQTTEEHNRQTFPFTIWPLTYRTCEVTTSPALCSPMHIPATGTACNFSVKLFKCNEVMIICVQCHLRNTMCSHPCLADCDGRDGNESEDTDISHHENGFDNHVACHALSRTEQLLPCHIAHCYNHLKTKINDAFYASQEDVECVICTGHGAAAAIASCLASDMSNTYEAEKEFLGLDGRRVCVDFIGFSENVVASEAYWTTRSSCIDNYISVVFESSGKSQTIKNRIMVVNPRCTRVIIDSVPGKMQKPSLSRSKSMLQKLSRRKDHVSTETSGHDRHISDYVSALNNKINLPLGSSHSELSKQN